MRAELESAEVPYPTTIAGQVGDTLIDDEHGSHVFLYVPDLTERSGYSTHRVPDPKGEPKAERRMGFRR